MAERPRTAIMQEMKSTASDKALWAAAMVCLLLAAFTLAVSWSDGARTYAVVVVALAVLVGILVQRIRSALVFSVTAGACAALLLSVPTGVLAIINPL
jgi:hypothetical protein